jgi:DNA polymerase III delta prime subunit
MTSGELADAVAKRVISFETNYLSTFSKNFKYSKFLEYIDGTDNSIQSTTAIIRLRKQFVPSR